MLLLQKQIKCGCLCKRPLKVGKNSWSCPQESDNKGANPEALRKRRTNGPADNKNPSQLQRTAWFYLGLFFGRRGLENQREMKPGMLALRKNTTGSRVL